MTRQTDSSAVAGQPVMTLPYRDRLSAIRAKYKAFGFSGPTAQDRERDQVIGFLLDELESQDFTLKSADIRERRHREASLRASQYGAIGWLLTAGLGVCLCLQVTGQGIAVAMGSAFLVGTLGVSLMYRVRKRDRQEAEASCA